MKFKYIFEGNGYDRDAHMSVNAVNAYDDGEMPLSKWTKSAFLNAIKKYETWKYNSFDTSKFKKLTKEQIVKYFLERTSWHHTGMNYRKTDFYAPNLCLCSMYANGKFTLDDIVPYDALSFFKRLLEILNKYINVQKLEDSGMHRNIIVETCVTQMSEYGGSFNFGILNHDAIQKLAKKGFKI